MVLKHATVKNGEAAMRAVWYDRQGAADHVLICGELPTPEAGHGEVRVRLEASGVNPSDTYRRRGPPAATSPHPCAACGSTAAL
jgi:NADPH:quinone reductase-like Zn-dependent oxidoreductase